MKGNACMIVYKEFLLMLAAEKLTLAAEYNWLVRLSRSKATNCRCLCRVFGIFTAWPNSKVHGSICWGHVQGPLLWWPPASILKPLDISDSILFYLSVSFCDFVFQLIQATLNEGRKPSLISDEIILEQGILLTVAAKLLDSYRERGHAWALRAFGSQAVSQGN